MSENQLPDELHEFEAALRSLSPHPPRIDPARLMYRAGQESVRATLRPARWTNRWWPVATGLSSALALILALVISVRPQPEPVVVWREIRVPAAAPDRPAADLREASVQASGGSAIPPAATESPEEPRVPPARLWAALAWKWPVGNVRERQLAHARKLDGRSLASAAGAGVRSASHRELLDQYLRASGFEPPASRAAFGSAWPFAQTGVQP